MTGRSVESEILECLGIGKAHVDMVTATLAARSRQDVIGVRLERYDKCIVYMAPGTDYGSAVSLVKELGVYRPECGPAPIRLSGQATVFACTTDLVERVGARVYVKVVTRPREF